MNNTDVGPFAAFEAIERIADYVEERMRDDVTGDAYYDAQCSVPSIRVRTAGMLAFCEPL
jgi:hypothetical protein